MHDELQHDFRSADRGRARRRNRRRRSFPAALRRGHWRDPPGIARPSGHLLSRPAFDPGTASRLRPPVWELQIHDFVEPAEESARPTTPSSPSTTSPRCKPPPTNSARKFSAKERKQLNLSRFYAIAQIEYCRNFIFKRNFPIHKLFERSCELGLWRLTGDKITEIFGTRLNRRMRGKLATVIDRIEHGHHVFRAYFKNAFLKQYEKFSTFLRNELVSNNLADFRLKKGLDHLDAVRERFQTITARFAGFQAQWLNVHVDFPLLQRLALPITVGAVRYPGIKIHNPRVIRLLEVLLHGG